MPPPSVLLLPLLLAAARAATVTIPGLGAVQGVANSLAEEYRAIPYAVPPERWASPVPPAAWAPAVLDGTRDPAGCMQNCHEPQGVCPETVSEDCLYLNIFRPLGAPVSPPLPVLVFIHGGNFRDGFAGGLLYNGTFLATTGGGAVVVAISYRLGVFGFLYGGAAPGAPPGNLGLVDQRAALTWVRDHISAFGGDPSRVTLFGQSAGAMSVASHMIAPASRGLFAAAFAISEPFDLPFRDPQSALAAFEAVTWAAGCAGAASASACLRALPAQALLAAQVAAQANLTDDSANLLQAFMPFCPTTGLPDVPNWPLYSFQQLPGTAPVADVPFLASTTSSEGSLFIYAAFGKNVSALEYDAVLTVFFGAQAAPRVAAQYPVPAPPPDDMRPLTSNVTTDDIFRCATRNATRALAAAPGRTAPVYLARFSALLSWSAALWTNLSVICWTQVCHGADLPFWWQAEDPPRSAWQPDELRLSAAMRAYLVSFAASAGASMGSGLPDAPVAWPPLDAATGAAPLMELALPAWRVSDEAGYEACALWDAIGYSNDGAWGAAGKAAGAGAAGVATRATAGAAAAPGSAAAAPVITTYLGGFSCNGGLTEGPGFLTLDGDALIVTRFSGDPLEADDVAAVRGFVSLLAAGGNVSASVCTRLAALSWPNDAEPAQFDFPASSGGAPLRALLAPGGFLVPPKTVGAITLLNTTGGAPVQGAYTLSAPKGSLIDGWFYHRAAPLDVDGDGLLDVLAARATKPLLGDPAGELVWLRQPPGGAPLAPGALPWAEAVLASGAWAPDVLFAPPVSLRGDGDAQLLYASFFTGGGIAMLECAGCAGAAPSAHWATARLAPVVLDATIGPAFDVAVLDLNGDGRLDVLATNHADNATAVNGTVYQSLVVAYEAPPAPVPLANASAWVRHEIASGFLVREPGPNQAAPGAARALPPPAGAPGGKPWISVSGDGDQRAYVLTPTSQDSADWGYTRTLVHDCRGTVGRQIAVAAGGRTFLVVPCYDSATIEVYELAAA